LNYTCKSFDILTQQTDKIKPKLKKILHHRPNNKECISHIFLFTKQGKSFII